MFDLIDGERTISEIARRRGNPDATRALSGSGGTTKSCSMLREPAGVSIGTVMDILRSNVAGLAYRKQRLA
jgi:hypothetical protein